MKKKAQKEYTQLLVSGMFWEFYPKLSGQWEIDEEQWYNEFKSLLKIRREVKSKSK